MPLTGVNVLDFSQILAGPSATMMLGDLGANVTKIEKLSGDISRNVGKSNTNEESAMFLSYNRNKRSISLDLNKTESKEIIRKLILQSDIVIESFKPGTMEIFRLDYEEVKKIKPDIIYASLSGFGNKGSQKNRKGVDVLLQAESGMMSINGEADGPPLKVGLAVIDAAAGLAFSQAILAALYKREKTGESEFVEMSLLDVAIYLQALSYMDFSISGTNPKRWGNSASFGYPYDLFLTKDGKYIVIAAYLPDQWDGLCEVLGENQLKLDPRFETNTARLDNKESLYEILKTIFITKTKEEWTDILLNKGIMIGDVKSYTDVMENPQLKLNRTFLDVKGNSGNLKAVRTPFQFESWSPSVKFNPPKLGEHSVEILKELGYTEEEINQLLLKGIIKKT